MISVGIHKTKTWAPEFYPKDDCNPSFGTVRLIDSNGSQVSVFYDDIESIQNHITALVDLMHKMEDETN